MIRFFFIKAANVSLKLVTNGCAFVVQSHLTERQYGGGPAVSSWQPADVYNIHVRKVVITVILKSNLTLTHPLLHICLHTSGSNVPSLNNTSLVLASGVSTIIALSLHLCVLCCVVTSGCLLCFSKPNCSSPSLLWFDLSCWLMPLLID